jgi:hypothetical protein
LNYPAQSAPTPAAIAESEEQQNDDWEEEGEEENTRKSSANEEDGGREQILTHNSTIPQLSISPPPQLIRCASSNFIGHSQQQPHTILPPLPFFPIFRPFLEDENQTARMVNNGILMDILPQIVADHGENDQKEEEEANEMEMEGHKVPKLQKKLTSGGGGGGGGGKSTSLIGDAPLNFQHIFISFHFSKGRTPATFIGPNSKAQKNPNKLHKLAID